MGSSAIVKVLGVRLEIGADAFKRDSLSPENKAGELGRMRLRAIVKVLRIKFEIEEDVFLHDSQSPGSKAGDWGGCVHAQHSKSRE